jgi:hypothetical protein
MVQHRVRYVGDQTRLMLNKVCAIPSRTQVLSNEKTRRAYDDFLAHPERHVWQHYGAYYQAYYAPKSDVRAVLAGIVLVISAVQYISVKHKQNLVKDIVLGKQ